MRPWPLAAALLLLLAGCSGSTDTGTAAPAGLVFQDVARVPGEQVAAEPNFAAGSTGLFLVAPGSLVSQPNVVDSQVSLWGSPDGAAWSALRTPSPRAPNGTFCSCDSDVDVGPDGTLYLTDFWVTSNANGFVVQSSTDGGHAWSKVNFVPIERPRDNDRQYILAGRDAGEVYLAYARALNLPVSPPVPLPVGVVERTDAGLHLLRSTDGGTTFTPLPQVFHEAEERGEFIAKPRLGPDGTFYYPWVEATNSDPWNGTATAVVAVSHDHGMTFSKRTVAQIPGGVGGLWPFELDVGGDGSLVAAWMERQPGAGSRVYFASSSDQGVTWTAPLKVAGGTAL
ncbi:MAG: hypothetical protein QOI63_682, partial [Thermoplasmata archaeon]|nr:hypothetical protein [Thermoplasmata archaeon]